MVHAPECSFFNSDVSSVAIYFSTTFPNVAQFYLTNVCLLFTIADFEFVVTKYAAIEMSIIRRAETYRVLFMFRYRVTRRLFRAFIILLLLFVVAYSAPRSYASR